MLRLCSGGFDIAGARVALGLVPNAARGVSHTAGTSLIGAIARRTNFARAIHQRACACITRVLGTEATALEDEATGTRVLATPIHGLGVLLVGGHLGEHGVRDTDTRLAVDLMSNRALELGVCLLGA